MSHTRKREWTHNGKKRFAWVASYIDQGGVKRQKTFKTQRAADRFRSQVDVDLEKGVHVADRATLPIADIAESYLRDCERRYKIGDRMGRTCLYNYQLTIKNHIIPRFGKKLATELKAEEVQVWIDEMTLTFKRQTVARNLGVLKLMMSYAVRQRLVMRNVLSEGAARVPSMKKDKVKIPTREQISSIFAKAADREPGEVRDCAIYSRLVVHLALLCGMRASEISGLDWKSVHFDESYIQIDQSYSVLDGLKDPKTKAGYRRVHLSPPVAEALRDVATYKGPASDGPVFMSRARRRHTPHGVWVLWRNAARRAGLANAAGKNLFRLHDLRHAAISLMIGEKLSPMHIKTFAGHAKISTTMDVYGHLFPDDMSITNASAAVAAKF